MMAGAEEPATLSGLRQAMAIAMVGGRRLSGQRRWMVLDVDAVNEGLEGSGSLMMTRFWCERTGIPIGERRDFSHTRSH